MSPGAERRRFVVGSKSGERPRRRVVAFSVRLIALSSLRGLCPNWYVEGCACNIAGFAKSQGMRGLGGGDKSLDIGNHPGVNKFPRNLVGQRGMNKSRMDRVHPYAVFQSRTFHRS